MDLAGLFSKLRVSRKYEVIFFVFLCYYQWTNELCYIVKSNIPLTNNLFALTPTEGIYRETFVYNSLS